MRKVRYSQGERIARIIHLLATEGHKTHHELRERFPMFSEATIARDVKLLKKTGLVVEGREPRITDEILSRKIFVFFKDDKDIVGKTKRAMKRLKADYQQVTLDQIASNSGLPPDKELQEAAYALAQKLGLLVGKEAIVKPPPPLIVGAHQEEKQASRRRKKRRRRISH